MPETVIMMLKRWIWLPLIHIMKHMKPTFLNTPWALPYSADCFASSISCSFVLETDVETCHVKGPFGTECRSTGEHQRNHHEP